VPPATPGLEGMGEVAAVGEGVTHLSAGQRVIPLGVAGTWAEYVIAPAMQLIPVPDAVNDQTAAQFVVNPLTAWIMTVEELGLRVAFADGGRLDARARCVADSAAARL
jgi:NADPH:quinone reductase-like Zn-dependent oxidoreductase